MAGKTYYLVDLENVGLDGIQGSGGLRSDDEVHIFSTSNGPKMDIATLAKLNNLRPSFHDVPPKKQSVDMHLVSYLGYLIKSEPKAEFVIVSKDTDYDNIIRFWKNEANANVSRKGKLQSTPKGKTADIKTESKQEESKKKPKASNATGSDDSESKREHQIRCFFGANFKEKRYEKRKEEIIKAVLSSKTKTQLNSSLTKLFPGSDVKEILSRLKPLIADLPGQ